MSPDSKNNGCISVYYEHLREDVLEAVPSNAKRVLSVGCAAGKTEETLIKKGIKVVGVELDHEAAEIARQRGLIVLEGDASKVDVNIDGKLYDCIIYADVLEHLQDPVAVLKRHIKSLRVGGIVYITVPNFRHYSVFWQLFVRGHIKYVDAGILDRTHVKITTRKMILEWFEQTGLRVLSCRYRIWGRRYKLLSACLFGLAREFIAHQVVLTGEKTDEKPISTE